MLDASDFVLRNHFRFFVVKELVNLMAFWSPFFSFSMAVCVKEKSLANRMEANVTWTKSTSSSCTVHLLVMSAMRSSTCCFWIDFGFRCWIHISFNHEFFWWVHDVAEYQWMNACCLLPFPFMFHRSNHPGADSISYHSSQMFVTPNDVWSAEWRGLCTSYQITFGNWEKLNIVHIKPLDKDTSWNIVVLYSLSQCLVGKLSRKLFP